MVYKVSDGIEMKKESTKQKIELAIKKVSLSNKSGNDNLKMDIATIAKLADIHRSTIHNRYPELAKKIKQIGGKSTSDYLKKSKDELSRVKTSNRNLRLKVRTLEKQLTDIASINASLMLSLIHI